MMNNMLPYYKLWLCEKDQNADPGAIIWTIILIELLGILFFQYYIINPLQGKER